MSYVTPPPPPPVGDTAGPPITVVGPQFVGPSVVDLIMTMKLMTLREGCFTITDLNDNVMFKVKGSFLSLHGTRLLLDNADRPLVSLRQEILSTHNRWKVYRGDSSDENDLLFTVQKSSVIQLKIQLDVFLAQNTNQQVPDFKIKGSTVYLGDSTTVIAQINKKRNVQSILLGKDKFAVTVYPNIDYAFVAALFVVLSGQPTVVKTVTSICKFSVGIFK